MVELCGFLCCQYLPSCSLDCISMFSRGLDFAPVDASCLKDDTPIIVVTHGLTGGKNQLVAEGPILIFCVGLS